MSSFSNRVLTVLSVLAVITVTLTVGAAFHQLTYLV